MYLRGRGNYKKLVKVGDAVEIHRMPGDIPHSRIASSKTPVVAAVRRGRPSKLVTVKYSDTQDGQTHLLEVPATHLRSPETSVLSIGDHVELKTRDRGVVVSIGSTGRVVGGGSDDLYVVTFFMTSDPTDGSTLPTPVTVTQDRIPRHTLQYVGEDSEGSELNGGADDSSESSADDIAEDTDTRRLDVNSTLYILQQTLKNDVYTSLVQLLSLDELDDLAHALHAAPDVKNVSVTDAVHMLYPTPSSSRKSTPRPGNSQLASALPVVAD